MLLSGNTKASFTEIQQMISEVGLSPSGWVLLNCRLSSSLSCFRQSLQSHTANDAFLVDLDLDGTNVKRKLVLLSGYTDSTTLSLYIFKMCCSNNRKSLC